MILQIEPTTRCNMNCRYCDRGNVSLRDLQLDTLKAIILRHRGEDRKGITWIRLHGLGEPFLTEPQKTKTKAWQFRLLCKTINLQGIKLSIVTNGLPGYQYKEIAHYCQELLFSIDTLDPDKYRKIKGNSPLCDLPGTLNVIKELRAKCSPFQAVGINQVLFPEVTPEDVIEVAQFCMKNRLMHYINPLQDWTGKDAKEGISCEWGKDILYYDADGVLHPCCRRKGDAWKSKDQTECGSCNGARTLGKTLQEV